jgi:hypothetical protein
MSNQRIDPAEAMEKYADATEDRLAEMRAARDEARAERDRLREEGLRAIAAIDEAISHYNISEAKRIARAMYDRWRVSP